MGQPASRGFGHLLFSPQTLVPVVLGLGSAAAVWALQLVGPSARAWRFSWPWPAASAASERC